ncbi:MAG TPA: tRNA1(Val) (adenine(37)-N6)-methyltransferase [Geobacteraceae bacterium]
MIGEAGGPETVDELRGYDLRIIQPRGGYRFSLDPLLLCDFAGVREGERVLDLGTGSGVIPLVLARQCGSAALVGVELQEDMAEMARRNVRLNGLSARVEIVGADILSLRERFPVSSFDLVVANPPYRRPGTGRISPKAGRDVARHETTATLADFLSCAKYHVRLGGRICFIYHPARLAEFLVQAAALKLAPLRLRMVHGNSGMEARIFLIELAKGRAGELKVLPPLFVYGSDGDYTPEMQVLFHKRRHPDE